MGNRLDGQQTTLRNGAVLCGTGVHSGKPVNATLHPADPDTGVVFHVNRPGQETVEFRALASEVGATSFCTILGDPAGRHVATVEHFMAAIFGLGVDNVVVEIDGEEAPILDGSSRQIVEALDHAGIQIQAAKRRYIRVLKPVRIDHGGSWAEFRPHDRTRFEVDIDFDSPAIGRQSIAADIDSHFFRNEIAGARTFGFLRDVDRLWASGHALGSSLDNSVVIGHDDHVINVEGLRWPDEFVRHKMLDAIGDLALAGARFIGCFRSYRGGHKLNLAALRRLLSDRSAYEIVETHRTVHGGSAELITVATPVYAPWAL